MLKKLILGLLLATGIASAALVDTDRALVDQVKNILENPGFENGKARWTASGGTFTVSSTGKAFGAAGALFDASSASQTLTSTAVAIPEGLKSKNAVVSCAIKTVSGSATHKLQAYDGANVVAEGVITSSLSSFARTSINFTAPSSGNLSARVISVAADEPQIYVDDCVVGLAEGFNLSQVSQATLYGGAVVTGCAGPWSTTSTTIADLSTQTSCSYATFGNASSPATMVGGIKFSTLPPGDYVVEYEGNLYQTTAAKSSTFKFWDGTGYARENSGLYNSAGGIQIPGFRQTFSYSTAQSNITFSIRALTTSGGTVNVYGTTGDPAVFRVYRFPTTSELAYRPESVSKSWSGWSNETYTFANSGLAPGDATTISGSSVFTAYNSENMSCSGTSGQAGITCTNVTPGKYLVCTSGNMQSNSSGSSNVIYTLTNGSNVILADGSYTNIPNNGGTIGFSNCGIYTQTALGSAAFKIRAGYNGTSVSARLVASNQSSLEFKIVNITSSVPTPVLIGSVTSGSSGAERIERVKSVVSCTSNPCTIDSQSGNWVSSWGRNSTGSYTINFVAGTFSAAPTCVVTGDNLHSIANTAPTTSAWTFNTYASAHTVADSGIMQVICMGPR